MRPRKGKHQTTLGSHYIFNKVSLACSALLLIFAIIALNPAINTANAANGYDQNLPDYEMAAASVTLTMDTGTNGSIRAGDTDGNTGLIRRTASVSVGTTSGYTVYLRANSANLTGKTTSNTIPSITTNSTLAQMVDKWGWYGELGDTAADCNPSGTFKQVPTSNTTLGTGTATTSTITKKITMCFGTRLSGAKAADTYSNTVTISVVAEPGQSSTRTFSNITTMQQMTASICSAAAVNDTSYLTDTRDNKKYWVTKMLDGNCWMSQNLDLNIATNNITTTTSDVTSNWTSSSTYPARATITSLSTGGTTATDTYSWDMGDYVLTSPTATTTCGANNTGVSGCSMFTKVGTGTSYPTASTNPNFYRITSYKGTDGTTDCTKNANTAISTATSGACAQYDAHYLAGNYYQWNAATAGTGGTIVNTNAAGSVCPKGWKLPDSNSTAKGSFYYLLQQYGLQSAITGTSGVNSNSYNIALSPLFLVRGGYIDFDDTYRFYNAGLYGHLWSSRARPSNTTAYYFYFYTSVYPAGYSGRALGFPIRCVATGN